MTFTCIFAGCEEDIDPERYSCEKELFSLLSDYDDTYKTYSSYNTILENSIEYNYENMSINFVFDEDTVFTDDNVVSVEKQKNVFDDYYSVVITVDESSAQKLFTITAENKGSNISCYVNNGATSTLILESFITDQITDGRLFIQGFFDNAQATKIYTYFIVKDVALDLKDKAIAYNENIKVYLEKYSLPKYLPQLLAIQPRFSDVSDCLRQAEKLGY